LIEKAEPGFAAEKVESASQLVYVSEVSRVRVRAYYHWFFETFLFEQDWDYDLWRFDVNE
jgi:hypothetical protein